MFSTNIPDSLKIEAVFGLYMRLDLLAARIIQLGDTCHDADLYYRIADWLISDDCQTPATLQLEVFG
jgi:hypothetical protein